MTEETAMQELEKRPLFKSIFRGLCQKCPNCGEGKIYRRYLKATDSCAVCGETLSHIRTDDFGPWLTIIILSHFVFPTIILLETYWTPPWWQTALVMLGMACALVPMILPFSKGAILGLMWALRIRGDEQH
ncbi:DUF983 domain-containing protein [Aestuariispira insulae]|uniref:Uncharacterized protein (DUF983 family) n=1 Tax=Aestuariispira insulae TaxID=1461337 RepID=A0A3D9HVK1_9PROT|nr:DUF983 domain-containing protein [Aestuariispira insulae]RED53411.1 uncharacterized protein (DUF983 family) [Aestuariispira insulae]